MFLLDTKDVFGIINTNNILLKQSSHEIKWFGVWDAPIMDFTTSPPMIFSVKNLTLWQYMWWNFSNYNF